MKRPHISPLESMSVKEAAIAYIVVIIFFAILFTLSQLYP